MQSNGVIENVMDEGQPNIPSLEPWAEPEISVLDVEDTHNTKGGRGHNPSRYPDCTRS